MATKQDVLACLRNIREEVDGIVSGAPRDAWTSPTYDDDGWTARDLLSHVASTSGVANYVLMLAKTASGAQAGGDGYDQDAFNRQQVAMRADRSVDDVADEIRSNLQRDIQAVEGTPDDLLQQHFAAPWGVEGTVAEVIITSLNGHLGGHLADLRGALAG